MLSNIVSRQLKIADFFLIARKFKKIFGYDYCEIHRSAISADNSQEVGYCGVPAVLPNESLFENLPVRSYHTQKQEEMMERAHLEQQGQGQFHTIPFNVAGICLMSVKNIV